MHRNGSHITRYVPKAAIECNYGKVSKQVPTHNVCKIEGRNAGNVYPSELDAPLALLAGCAPTYYMYSVVCIVRYPSDFY